MAPLSSQPDRSGVFTDELGPALGVRGQAVQWCHRKTGKQLVPSERQALEGALASRALLIIALVCGGILGYYDLLAALADPKHEQHEEMKEWVGGAWDATRFSLEHTNAGLKRIKA